MELDVVVVATKNRSGTIVPAEKQNEEDIKFSARHVCKVKIHENMASG